MNDRPQAGSALGDGRIQLMQNRQIWATDNKGMGQLLIENDEFGKGIRVKATYYV